MLNVQPSVRKTHNAGRKHKDNVRTFYQEWLDKQTASLMDRSKCDFRFIFDLVPSQI